MSNYSEKFEKMRIAGKLASKTLDMLTDEVKEGVSTNKIDQLGYEFIRDRRKRYSRISRCCNLEGHKTPNKIEGIY